MLVPGCAKKASVDTAAPGASEARDAQGPVTDDIGALEQQLAAREAQLRGAGYAVPTPEQMLAKKAAGTRVEEIAQSGPDAGVSAPTTAPAPADAGGDVAATPDERPEGVGGRCMNVCEISTAICELRDHICGLLPRHSDDPRYQAACDRAVADCQLSDEACHGCQS